MSIVNAIGRFLVWLFTFWRSPSRTAVVADLEIVLAYLRGQGPSFKDALKALLRVLNAGADQLPPDFAFPEMLRNPLSGPEHERDLLLACLRKWQQQKLLGR